MNNELLTITLLLVITCNLGILWLYLRVNRGQDALYSLLHLVLNRLSEAFDRQRGMKHALLDDGKLTRQRIAQVKTRLADEERDDQKAKRRARQGVKS
jgi:hypothetical protein